MILALQWRVFIDDVISQLQTFARLDIITFQNYSIDLKKLNSLVEVDTFAIEMSLGKFRIDNYHYNELSILVNINFKLIITKSIYYRIFLLNKLGNIKFTVSGLASNGTFDERSLILVRHECAHQSLTVVMPIN